jgi:hypothetical protein
MKSVSMIAKCDDFVKMHEDILGFDQYQNAPDYNI